MTYTNFKIENNLKRQIDTHREFGSAGESNGGDEGDEEGEEEEEEEEWRTSEGLLFVFAPSRYQAFEIQFREYWTVRLALVV